MKNYDSPEVKVQNVESEEIITNSIYSDTATAGAELEW